MSRIRVFSPLGGLLVAAGAVAAAMAIGFSAIAARVKED